MNVIDDRIYSKFKIAELHLEGARERLRSEAERAQGPPPRRPPPAFPAVPRPRWPRALARPLAHQR